MKKEEMMKFCRYYKGEDENPFRSSDGPKYAVAFWRLECAWVNGYQPQYTMALFKKYWPLSKPIFDTAGKGLPKSLKDSIASDIICGVNLMAELDPIEVLSAYFGLPCEDPSMVKEEETKKEPEVEPAQEEDEDAFFDEDSGVARNCLSFAVITMRRRKAPSTMAFKILSGALRNIGWNVFRSRPSMSNT